VIIGELCSDALTLWSRMLDSTLQKERQRNALTVKDVDAVFARAKALGCLSQEGVHGVSGGTISVRPWGERSF
jgi:hypothetical protein